MMNDDDDDYENGLISEMRSILFSTISKFEIFLLFFYNLVKLL